MNSYNEEESERTSEWADFAPFPCLSSGQCDRSVVPERDLLSGWRVGEQTLNHDQKASQWSNASKRQN